MRTTVLVLFLASMTTLDAAEMLPGLVYSKSELAAECELVSPVEGVTQNKKGWLPAANYRPIALRRMLIAAHEKGATHVFLKSEHQGNAVNAFLGYSMTGDAYRCPLARGAPQPAKATKRPVR